jgi:hypothetical protein
MQLSLAELVTKKREGGLEDIRKDIDILMNNFTVVENLSKDVARMQLETHLKVSSSQEHQPTQLLLLTSCNVL